MSILLRLVDCSAGASPYLWSFSAVGDVLVLFSKAAGCSSVAGPWVGSSRSVQGDSRAEDTSV